MINIITMENIKTKVCFKCLIDKPLTEYYKHKQMGDGHFNKCKECAKKDVKERYKELITDEAFVKSERKRGRDKYMRLYRYRSRPNPASVKKWINNNPEKRLATNVTQHIVAPFEFAEKHHWSYNKEHYKDVIFLTKGEHMKGHRFMIYDQERFMYRRVDNLQLLDTKEKHEEWIRFCIENEED